MGKEHRPSGAQGALPGSIHRRTAGLVEVPFRPFERNSGTPEINERLRQFKKYLCFSNNE